MSTPRKSTYKVTIKPEGREYIARDENGDWRTRGRIDGCDKLIKDGTCKDLAACMFHADEIESSETLNDGSCVAMIREW